MGIGHCGVRCKIRVCKRTGERSIKQDSCEVQDNCDYGIIDKACETDLINTQNLTPDDIVFRDRPIIESKLTILRSDQA